MPLATTARLGGHPRGSGFEAAVGVLGPMPCDQVSAGFWQWHAVLAAAHKPSNGRHAPSDSQTRHTHTMAQHGVPPRVTENSWFG